MTIMKGNAPPGTAEYTNGPSVASSSLPRTPAQNPPCPAGCSRGRLPAGRAAPLDPHHEQPYGHSPNAGKMHAREEKGGRVAKDLQDGTKDVQRPSRYGGKPTPGSASNAKACRTSPCS